MNFNKRNMVVMNSSSTYALWLLDDSTITCFLRETYCLHATF